MNKTNIFLLLPETEPQNQWMNTNKNHRTEGRLNKLITEILQCEQTVKIENQSFFYDGNNIKSFAKHFKTQKKYYPEPHIKRLKSFLKDKENWRDNIKQSDTKVYLIFKQPICDHTFCEIAERKISKTESKYILLNIYACKIKTDITVKVDNTDVLIHSIKTEKKLKFWFAKNRIPKRKFHKIEKHGEKGIGGFSNDNVSVLLCSKEKAQQLLNEAVGKRSEELFKSENYANQYHGFHVDKNSQEIPQKIKKILNIKLK